MTPSELEAQLAEGRWRPAYLIAGEEALLRDDALVRLRESVLADAPEAFNCDRLEGEWATPGALLDALNTLPVLSRHRLVVLREPEAGRGLTDALADWVAERGVEAERGEEISTVLAVVVARPDARARWVRAFSDASVVCCDPPRSTRALRAFARDEARRQGVVLERGVEELLCERLGPQLLMVRQELAKLALLAGPGEPITAAHVLAGASFTAEEPLWELTDAIGEGRGGEALVALGRLLGGGMPPPVVLGALGSHFRKLARLSSGASVAGPPFVRRKLESQARRYPPGRVLSCLRAIHATDVALKGEGALRPQMALERLVLGLSA